MIDTKEDPPGLVLWSGGCDSTLLLYQQAKRASVDSPARALSIIHPQIGAMKEQRAAREELKNRFGKLPIKYQEVEVRHDKGTEVYPGEGSNQYVVWVTLAQIYLKPEENLYIGYVRCDDIWHNIDSVKKTFDALQEVGGKRGQLKFPLEWWRKAEVIRELRKARLMGAVWWCENPKDGKKCGSCTPCRCHKTAAWEARQDAKRHNNLDIAVKTVRKKRKK